jgi:hypothetical protein
MNVIEALDRRWFLLLDASHAPPPLPGFAAQALAQWAPWIVVVAFGARGSARARCRRSRRSMRHFSHPSSDEAG